MATGKAASPLMQRIVPTLAAIALVGACTSFAQAQPYPSNGGPMPRPSPGGPPSMPHRPPSPPEVARFVFERGGARMEITCPQAFALQDCVQAATELLDKLESLHHHPNNAGPDHGSGDGDGALPPGGSGATHPGDHGSSGHGASDHGANDHGASDHDSD